MKSSTANPPSATRPPRGAARNKILAAAALVFARDGINGATTRCIAKEAGVNEVTLFRLFKNKEGLLSEVVGQNFGETSSVRQSPLPEMTNNLRTDLEAFAKYYSRLLQDNIQLVRTMVGEIHRHGTHEQQVLAAIFRPAREFLITQLQHARATGGVRDDIQPEILADIFTSMIFTGVLRCSSPQFKRGYSPAAYLKGVVEFTLSGMAR